MNTNGNGNNEGKLFIDCPNCKQRFSTKLPTPEIVNAPRVSVITAAHEQPVKCICGQQFVLGMTHAQIGWASQPIQAEQPRIIVPQLRPV